MTCSSPGELYLMMLVKLYVCPWRVIPFPFILPGCGEAKNLEAKNLSVILPALYNFCFFILLSIENLEGIIIILFRV